jgi:1-acyl-sn-glycerol-3-phosphate acyltransferase
MAAVAISGRQPTLFVLNNWKQHMLAELSKFVLRILGWTLEINLPSQKKYVLVGAPHTSNWDLPLGLLYMSAVGLRFSWAGKHTIFKGPIGTILRSLGGIPVDRRIRSGFIERMSDLFNTRETMILAITPEGTRSKVPYWKTGFYYIALRAKVPIILGYLDYKEKKLGMGYTFLPSGDIEKDMRIVRAFYKGKTGRHPEQQGEIAIRPK